MYRYLPLREKKLPFHAKNLPMQVPSLIRRLQRSIYCVIEVISKFNEHLIGNKNVLIVDWLTFDWSRYMDLVAFSMVTPSQDCHQKGSVQNWNVMERFLIGMQECLILWIHNKAAVKRAREQSGDDDNDDDGRLTSAHIQVWSEGSAFRDLQIRSSDTDEGTRRCPPVMRGTDRTPDGPSFQGW